MYFLLSVFSMRTCKVCWTWAEYIRDIWEVISKSNMIIVSSSTFLRIMEVSWYYEMAFIKYALMFKDNNNHWAEPWRNVSNWLVQRMVALPSHLAQHRQNTHNAHFFNRLGQLLSIRCFLLLILSSVAISQVSYYGRIFKELGGGKSFHLKRKTKHHKHHHHYRHHNVTPVAVISASTRTHGEDKGYSLRVSIFV